MSGSILPFPGAAESAPTDPIQYLDRLENTLSQNGPVDAFESQTATFLQNSQDDHCFAVLARACRILSRVNLQEDQPVAKSLDLPELEPHFLALRDAARSYVERVATHKRYAIKAGKDAFPPGYWFIDEFESIFGVDDDPLAYINKTLRALTLDPPYSHPEDCWYSDEQRFRLPREPLSFLVRQIVAPLLLAAAHRPNRNAVSRVGWPAIVSTLQNLLLSPLDDTLGTDEENTPERRFGVEARACSEADLAALARLNTVDGFCSLFFRPGIGPIPQGLFVSVLRRLVEGSSNAVEDYYEAIPAALGGVVSMPFGIPFGRYSSWDDVTPQLLHQNFLPHIAACYESPADIPFLPVRAFHYLGLFWGDLTLSLESDEYAAASGLMSQKMDQMISKLGGRFPLDPCSSPNWYSESIPPDRRWGLLFQLQSVTAESDGLEREGFHLFDSDPYGDAAQDGFIGFHRFRCVWSASHRVGLTRFGNAAFAFYLVRKVLTARELGTPPTYDWAGVASHVRKCIDTVGGHWVARAVEISHKLALSHGWTHVAAYLDSLDTSTDSRDEPSAVTIGGGSVLSMRINHAEKVLRSRLGPLCDRLQDRAFLLLCKADARFGEISSDLGWNLTDYGDEIVAYARPFEVELDARLRDVFASDACQDYLSTALKNWDRSRKPTLGSYLTLLQHTKGMPIELSSTLSD